jgi:dTDP-4-dehydrorhamnose reductase
MRVKRIMLLGGSGFLGENLVTLFSQNSRYSILASYNEFKPLVFGNWFQLSVSDHISLKNTIDAFKPDVILNCIALADVEKCEQDTFRAIEVNTNFPKILSDICHQTSTKLIQISTDHFSSNYKHPRNEFSSVWGVNNYGKTKLDGEFFVLQNVNNLVIRVNFFGSGNPNHKSTLDKLLVSIKENKDLTGFTNILFTPVSIANLYNYLEKLLELDVTGLINVASLNEISKYNFIKLVLEYYPNYLGTLAPLEFKAGTFGLVQRPEYMSLDSTYISNLTGIRALSVEKMIHQVLLNLGQTK